MSKGYHWGAMIRESMPRLINEGLSSAEYSIFFHLCYIADTSSNIANEKQKDIINNFTQNYNWEISKSTVSKSINKLIDKTLIVKPSNKGGYMVNPNIFYYGGSTARVQNDKQFAQYIQESGKNEYLYYDYDEDSLVNFDIKNDIPLIEI